MDRRDELLNMKIIKKTMWHYDTSVVLNGNSLIGQFTFGKRQLTVQQVYSKVTWQW